MDLLFALYFVAFFIFALFYLRDLRKKRARLKTEGSVDGIRWAERHYTDSQTKTVAARFVTILESQIHVPIERFFPTTRFLEDLGMDDLEPVEVLMAVEEDFHIKIADEDARRMIMIKDMVEYLRQLSADQPNKTVQETGTVPRDD